MRALLVGLALTAGCANHASDPRSCRERAAYHLADTYPDPNNLILAIDGVCQGVP